MLHVISLVLSCLVVLSAAQQRPIQWTFVQNGTSGVIPVEAIVISENLVLMYDRADGNPLLLPTGEGAWAAIWNLDTNEPTPITSITDTFCAGGAFISNGTLVSIAGQPLEDPTKPPADGRLGIRLFNPCTSPTGANCTVFEDPEHIHLAEMRWYPTGLRIADGSLMIIGGAHENTFYNLDAANSIEFWPSRPGEEGTVRPSQFLLDAEPVNLFPRSFLLPSGRVFVIANNISMLYDIDTNTEVARLPDIPNGVRIANPFDGTAQLLPLSPPLYEPTVLVCGGSATDDTRPLTNLSTQDPATNQCSRITLTPQGIARGWEVEIMPERRLMIESVMLPSGDVILINGVHSGYAGYPSVSDANATGMSNSDHPATRGILYRTEFPSGQRLTQEGLPVSDINRLYHSVAVLTPSGNIMVAGSNPHPAVLSLAQSKFPTEFRVQYLNPDFITTNAPRPAIVKAPKQILFNQKVQLTVNIPPSLRGAVGSMKVSLMDLGYNTHAQHGNSRLVFLEHTLEGNTLTITAPPNNFIYPPGPAFLYIVVNGVHSQGVMLMVGDGGNPPRPDQGIKIPLNSI